MPPEAKELTDPQHWVDLFHQIGEMLDPLPDEIQRRVIAGIAASFIGTFPRQVWTLVTAELLGEIQKALEIVQESEEED